MMDSIFVRKSYLGAGKGWKAVKAMTAAERKGALEHAKQVRTARKFKQNPRYAQDSVKDRVKREDDKELMRRNRQALHSRSREVGGGRRVLDSDKVTPGMSFIGRYGNKTVLGRSRMGEAMMPNSLAHEMEHARPKRTAHRFQEVVTDAKKLGREEARADYMSGTGNYRKPADGSAYAKATAGDQMNQVALGQMLPGQDIKGFTSGYREIQDKLHAKGIRPGARQTTNEKYARKNYKMTPGGDLPQGIPDPKPQKKSRFGLRNRAQDFKDRLRQRVVDRFG